MKTALSLDALCVTAELHVLFAYIQSDSGSEKSNIIDQWSEKEIKSIIMPFSL